MKRKAFTLVELLVVIAIIALLMGILMPALARVRAIAQRVVCGAHLSSTGKAIMLYANEYQGKYPRAGGANSTWGRTTDFSASPAAAALAGTTPEKLAFGEDGANMATIGASLFYLVRYADASAKTFLCGGDTVAKEFKLVNPPYNKYPVYNNDITEAWDFGGDGTPPGSSISGTPIPAQHYSYSYQFPYGNIGGTFYFPLTGTSDSGLVMMADKSPYLVLSRDLTWKEYKYKSGNKEYEKWGNSANHNKEGQNVLFNDGHASFENVPYCGVGSDNIYTVQINSTVTGAAEQGQLPVSSTWCFNADFQPIKKSDSVLLNEGINQTQLPNN